MLQLFIAYLTIVMVTDVQGKLEIKGPKTLNDKIAVVGAGPSGVHMALRLKELGFKNVEILEKNAYVGGKSWTINHRGAAHEMGSVYLAPDYIENVIPLVEKYMPGDLVPLPPASIWLDNINEPLSYEYYLLRYAMIFYKTSSPTEAVSNLNHTIFKYISKHREIFGQYEGDLMPEPTPEVKVEIRGTFLEFLEKHNLLGMAPILYASSSVQGYGRLDEIPALYGLMWNTPNLMAALLKRLSGQTEGTGLYMLRHGFKTLWEKIIEKENLKVTFEVKIQKLYRVKSSSKKEIKILMKAGENQQSMWHTYDFVIWSPEMKTSFNIWDENEEEIYYFSRTKPSFFTTALVDTNNTLRGLSPIDYWFDNINKKRQHSLWAQRDSYAALNGIGGDLYKEGITVSGNDGTTTRTTITYQMSDSKPIYTLLRRKLEESLKKINATSVKVYHMKTWRYFPRYSVKDLEEGMLWRILEMQGKYDMWYIGSSVSFESVKSVIEYNKMVLKHFIIPTN